MNQHQLLSRFATSLPGFIPALLALCCLSGVAHADSQLLEDWRSAAAATRMLAENDVPRAHDEALRLQAQLPTDATSADKVKVLNLLARTEGYLAQADAALNHAQQALEMAKLANDRLGQAEAYLNIALDPNRQGRNIREDDAPMQALDALQGSNRPDLVGEAMLREALMRRRIGWIESSVTLCMQAMDIAISSHDPLALLYAHHGLAISDNLSGRSAEANEHFTQMRKLAQGLHMKYQEADALAGMASTSVAQQDLRANMMLVRQAMALYQETGSPIGMAQGLAARAHNLSKQGLLDETVQTLGESIALYRRYPNKMGMWWSLNTRSEMLQKLGRLKEARIDAELAYALAQEIDLPYYRINSRQRMAAVEASSGDLKRAYELSMDAEELAVRERSDKGRVLMASLVKRYQEDSRRQEINELNHQHELDQAWHNQLRLLLLGGLALLSLSAYFMLRLQRSNVQLRQSREQTRALNAGLEQRVQEKTAELSQQMRFLDRIINSISDPIFVKDREHNWILLNDAFCKFIGRPKESMLGKSDYDFFPAYQADVFWEKDEAVFNSGLENVNEEDFTDAEGITHTILTKKTCYTAADGQQFLVGTIMDITELKRAEAVLRERAKLEERLSAMAASIPGFVFTIRVDTDGHTSFPFASDGVENLFGLRAEDIRADAAVLRARYHPDDLPRIRDLMTETARTLAPFRIEIRIQNRDQGQSWIEIRSTPQRQPDGATEWHGIMLDITERKRIEKELKGSEQRYLNRSNLLNSIFESSPDVITFSLDRDYRYIAFNQKHKNTMHAIWGKEIALGMNMLEEVIGLQPDRESAKQGFDRALAGESFVLEESYGNDRLSRLYWQNYWSPIRSDEGEIIGLSVFCLNISERKQMENMLQAREQQLRSLADSSPGMMGAFYARPDGSVCMPYVSPNIEKLFGIHPQDVAHDASALMALNHPDDAQRVAESIAESARNMTLWHEEYRILHPTLGERWMESNTMPMPHPDGGVIWYGYVHEITERKEAEQTRKKFARALKLLSESSMLPVHAKNEQELLGDACRFAIELGGYRMAWVGFAENDEHKTVRPVAQSGFDDGYLDGINVTWADTERGQGPIGIAIRTGAAVINHDFQSNSGLAPWRDAAIRRGYRSSIALPLASKGQVLGSFNIYSAEIHAFRNDEEVALLQKLADHLALGIGMLRTRIAMERLDRAINRSSDAIYIIDEQLRFNYVNATACQSLGYTKEEMLSMGPADIDPDATLEQMRAIMKDSPAGSAVRFESHHRTKDGRVFPIELSGVHFEEGGAKFSLSVVRDISGRKEMELARESALSEAVRLGQVRSAFLAQMSHELRTPLNGILGYTQNLLLGGGLGEVQVSGLNIIRHSGEHLLSLINGILDHAAMEADKLELVPGDIRLEEFLSLLIGMIRIRAEQKNIAFVCEADTSLPGMVRGDAQRLRQVLLNLLSNAVKFTDRGQVTLRVSCSPSRLRFEVRDSGVGISSDQLENIFLPFEQVGESSRRAGGSGLGLAISRKLARLMGGDIKVESRLGEGSTFWFEIDMQTVQSDAGKVDVATLSEQAATRVAQLSSQLVVPPIQELDILHGLALRGSMREVMRHAERLLAQDERYRLFCEQLRQLAKNFQTKMLLNLIDQYRKEHGKA